MVCGLGIMREMEMGDGLRKDAGESIHLTPGLFEGWNEEDKFLRVVLQVSSRTLFADIGTTALASKMLAHPWTGSHRKVKW